MVKFTGDWERVSKTLSREAMKEMAAFVSKERLRLGLLVQGEIRRGMSKGGRFGVSFSGTSSPGVPRARTPYPPLSVWGFLSRNSSKSLLSRARTAKSASSRKNAFLKLLGQSNAAIPLLDSGEMFRSVGVHKVGKRVFVGVNRNFIRDGRTINLAFIHEFGAVARLPNGKGTRIIPARPFIRPGFKAALPKIKEKLKDIHKRAALALFGGT